MEALLKLALAWLGNPVRAVATIMLSALTVLLRIVFIPLRKR